MKLIPSIVERFGCTIDVRTHIKVLHLRSPGSFPPVRMGILERPAPTS